MIRKSDGKADAAEKIMKRFELDADQTDAILELKIYRLARLEILIIRTELEEKRKRARQIAALLKNEDSRWTLVRSDIETILKTYGNPKVDKRRTTIESDSDEPEYTPDDFIVEEDNVVIVSGDGWVKRQKEVKDVATTRLREGDSVLAVLAGSTRASCVFFSNFGVAYTSRFIDVPASTGYGEPIQRFFKLKDGEKIVAALSLDPRAIGDIKPPAETAGQPAADPARRRRHERRLYPAIRSRGVRRAQHARREALREAGGRGGGRRGREGDRRRGADRRHRRRAGAALPGRRSELPVRSRQGRHPDQALGRGSRARVHRLGGRSRSADGGNDPRRGADHQHDQVRSDRARRQGARAASARPVHAHRAADARGAGPTVEPGRTGAARIVSSRTV